MTRFISSLAEIAMQYDALFCDLWGCVHNGKTPWPAAVAALRAFRQGGGRVILLTNAPRPAAAVIEQIDGLGMPRDAWDAVVTSGDAAQFAMVSGAVGRRVHHIGAPKDEPFFTEFAPDIAAAVQEAPPIERVPLDEAEGIVCTGLRDDHAETPADYRGELLLAREKGLVMLCANPDIIVHYGTRELWCAGALAREYESMGGRALYFGKPHPPIYDLARRRLGRFIRDDDARILCIGDGIDTDVRGAVGEDLDVVFITSGIDTGAFGPDPAHPDPALLDAWLAEKTIAPTFVMGHLG